MQDDVHVQAAVAIFLMVVVTTFMDWVPTRLNRNILTMTVRERLPSTVIHSFLGFAFALANVFAYRWAIFVGALWYSIVLAAAIRNWWIPYFVGIHQGEIGPEDYSRYYAQNVRILPAFRGNPVIPDVQHMLIHATVLLATVLSWRSFWSV